MMEQQQQNDLFFVCSLIEKIARETRNPKKLVVEELGKLQLEKIWRLADVYHSDNIDKVVNELVNESRIELGSYDVLAGIRNPNPPSIWDMGRVYQRLILSQAAGQDEYIEKLFEVMTSWLIPHLDNYDSSLYYESPGYLTACYEAGEIVKE